MEYSGNTPETVLRKIKAENPNANENLNEFAYICEVRLHYHENRRYWGCYVRSSQDRIQAIKDQCVEVDTPKGRVWMLSKELWAHNQCDLTIARKINDKIYSNN